MARLTKKQRAELERVLYHLGRAQRYIVDPSVAIAHRGDQATTTLHYTRADGKALYEVAKDIGSDLTGLYDAFRGIQAMIESDNAERLK